MWIAQARQKQNPNRMYLLRFDMKVRLLALTVSILCVIGAITLNLKSDNNPKPFKFTYFQAKEVIAPLPIPEPEPMPELNKAVKYHNSVIRECYLNKIILPVVSIELESIGTHFITAYNPYECGYNGYNYPAGWITASGEICHRASYHNRYTEPTTCAIDRNYYSFGDLFYIAEFDRVFVAEDTGSGVKKYHLDLFYDDDISGFPTGYYEVYSVEYTYDTVYAVDYDVRKVIQEVFIYDECSDCQASYQKGRML